jgi:hypothetical protein
LNAVDDLRDSSNSESGPFDERERSAVSWKTDLRLLRMTLTFWDGSVSAVLPMLVSASLMIFFKSSGSFFKCSANLASSSKGTGGALDDEGRPGMIPSEARVDDRVVGWTV